jgi:competence protein ComEA
VARRFAAVWPQASPARQAESSPRAESSPAPGRPAPAAGYGWPDTPGRREAEEAWRSLDAKPVMSVPARAPAEPVADADDSPDGLLAGPPPGSPPGSPPGPPAGRAALGPFDPGRRGVRLLAVVALVVVLVAGYFAWRARPQPEPVPVTGGSAAPSASGGTVAPSGTIVVAVQGKVAHPGLYRLPAGSRVADALEAAGGALPGVDLSYVNLARKLADGELILVGATPPPDSGPAAAPGGKLDLNLATVTQLEALPGIGPALAQRIVDYRNQHGGFHSVDELRKVGGIGDAKFAQIKDLVTV